MDSAVLIELGHLAIWTVVALALAGAATFLVWTRGRAAKQEAVAGAIRGFALLVERSADPIVIVDELGAISYANPSVERVFGYRVDTTVPNALDLLHPDEVDEAVVRIAAVAQGAPTNELVLRRVRHADGRWLWCETVNTNLLAEPSVGGVVIVLRDITERVAAEARAEAEHRLTETILATMTALVVTTTMEGRIVSMNRAAEQLVGRSIDEVRGQRAAEFVPEDERILAEGEIDPERLPAIHENHWSHVGGRRHLVSWRNAVLRDADGRPTSIVATGTDVTVERRAQGKARQAERREHDRLAYEATHDVLTEVLNRAGLLHELDNELRMADVDAPVSVLFLDLDGFKVINDTHGHPAGDAVLKVVAERLVDEVRSTDIVGRLGGDEFVVLCPDLDGDRATSTVARIDASLARPIDVEGTLLRCGASIGLVTAAGGQASELLKQADAAMYDTKRTRRLAPVVVLRTPSYPLDPNESVRLSVLRRLGLLDSAADPFVDTIVRLAADVCGVPIAAVSLIDVDRQWFKSSIGLDATETPRSQAFCAHTILDVDSLFVVADARRDERFQANPLVTGDPNIRFYAGAPIAIGGETAIGSLCVIDHLPRELTAQQLATLLRLRDSLVTYLELTTPDGSSADLLLD